MAERPYLALLRGQVRAQTAYRRTFAIDLVSNVWATVVDVVTILVLFRVTSDLGGFTRSEALVVVGLSACAFACADLAVGNIERLRQYVRTGLLDALLVRPLRVLPQLLAMDLPLRKLSRAVFGATVLVVLLALADIEWTPVRLALAVAAPVGGTVFFAALFVAGSTVAFWWIESGELSNSVTYGGRETTTYPVTVYEGLFRRVFVFTFGFGFVAYYPRWRWRWRWRWRCSAGPTRWGCRRSPGTSPRWWRRRRWRWPGCCGGPGFGTTGVRGHGHRHRGARAAQGVHRAGTRPGRHRVAPVASPSADRDRGRRDGPHRRAGELLGYIGPNGAGTSTTLKMMTGILTPSGGSVRVCGLVPVPQRRALAHRIGVVSGQRSLLWWDLPLAESFDLLRHVYRVPAATHAARLRRCRDLLELDGFLDTPVRQLSLGQRMRGEITAALLHGPQVLFLDEPTIGLDVLSRQAVRGFVADLAATGDTTIVLTTHDLNDIERLARRLVVIDHGRLVHDGSLASLHRRYGSTRKVVVDLAGPLARPVTLPGVRLVATEADGHRLTFALDAATAGALVAELARVGSLRGVSVVEPTIEEVVARLYTDRPATPAARPPGAGAAIPVRSGRPAAPGAAGSATGGTGTP